MTPAAGPRSRRTSRAARHGRPIPPDLAAATEAFLVHLRVERGLSAATLASYGSDLADFARSPGAAEWGTSPGAAIDYLAGQAGAIDRSGRVLRATSLRRRTAALRSFYRFALSEELVGVDIAGHLDLPREPRILPDPLTVDEVDRLLAAVDPDRAAGDETPERRGRTSSAAVLGALRDRALLELLYAAGLRVSEALGLDGDDLDLDGASVRVVGKGDREREVPVGDVAIGWLRRYLETGRPALAAADSARTARGGPVFLSDRGRRLGRNHALVRREAGGRRSRSGRPRLAPHSPPLLRDASPGRRRGPPRRTGVAGSCEYLDHADLHAPHGRADPRGVCPGASPGVAEERETAWATPSRCWRPTSRNLYRTKQHWMAPIFGTIAGVLVLVGGVVLFILQLTAELSSYLETLAFWASIILVVVGVGMVGYSYIQWWVEDYAVTNQKVDEGRRVAAQADERRGAGEDQRRDHGAGTAGPDARLRDAEGGHRVRLDRPGLRDHAQAGRVPARDARPEDGVRAGRCSAHRRGGPRGRRRRPGRCCRRRTGRPARTPGDRGAPAEPAAPAAPSADDKLRSLARLRDDGLITAEDYEAEKAELLGAM